MFLHALLTSLPLLAGFTVQDLLATWLCWLASTLGGGGEELFGIQLYLALAQNPTQKYE